MVSYENTKTIRDLIENSAAQWPDHAFLRHEMNDIIYDITYQRFAELCRIVGAWANSLRKAKERTIKVALLGSASVRYVPTLLGVMGSGNTAVPLDIQLDRDHLADCLDRSDVDVLFYDWEYEPIVSDVKGLCPKVEEYYSFQSVKNIPCLNDILRDPRWSGKDWGYEGDDSSIAPEDLAMILFTSGTTGHSKGVMLSNGNLVDNVFSTSIFEEPGTAVFLNILPIHHVFCLSCDFLLALSQGATTCINGPLSQLARHLLMFEPNVVHIVPMIAKSLYNRMMALMAADPGLADEDVLPRVYGRNIHRIVCGGGGLALDLALKYHDLGVLIGQGYGMSECSPIISSADYYRADKLASAGLPVKRCEVRIKDGEIQVKSPSVMQGYYNDPELTKEAFTEDGWLKTGDLGYIDDEGFLYLTGRVKNLIILSNGENVAPEELEAMFATEQLIEDIVVYADGDRIACEIYPNFAYAEINDISDIQSELETIVRKYNGSLPTYKRITKTTLRRSPFPKTTSKKIIREAYFQEKQSIQESEASLRLPETELQKAVYDLCADTIGHRHFGIDADLYESGLDSLGSILLLTALQEKLDFVLTLSELMENATVEELVLLKEKKDREPKTDYTPREEYPLTRLQKYFAYVMRGNTTANLPFAFKLDNRVDLDRMEKAMRELFKIHPVLTDRIEPGADGMFVNKRDDSREPEIERLTLTDAEWEEKRQKLLEPFWYLPGSNLYHFGLYKTDSAKYMLFDVAHIIGDGQTMQILTEDLNNLYLEQPVPRSDYSFYEYILDELEGENNGQRAKALKYQASLMKDYAIRRSVLAKKDSYDLTVVHNASIRGRFKSLNVRRVKGFCDKYGVSENVVFLTAFNYCVAMFADSDDVVSTSIHNGRTDGRWMRMAGSLFCTYLYRYQRKAHETVPELLKRMAEQILHTMETRVSSVHADEMFIQYQADLLKVSQLGGREVEQLRFQLDSLPFHLMIYSDGKDYTYELRYWENRFDRDVLQIFLTAMENVIYAMPEESSVRRLKKHLAERLFPRHFTVQAEKLNAALGQKLLKDVDEKTSVQVYVLDSQGLKKPFGAWGELYILDHQVEGQSGSMESQYTPGILYDTGIVARITPSKQVEALYQGGRTIMQETLTGRFYPNLFELDRLLESYPGITEASSWLKYCEATNLFTVAASVKAAKEPDIEALKTFIGDRMGKYIVPTEITVLK